MTIVDAEKILNEWVLNVNLKKHMIAVSAAMRFYAEKFKEDENKWEIVGLLHDMDYEKYPDPQEGGHPYKAVEYLRNNNLLDEESINAILAHADYTNTLRESLMAKTLYAVDELCGFAVAVTLIKPNKSLDEVDVKSVIKRLKEKRFAAAVNREEIYNSAKELGIDLEEHITNVIEAIKSVREKLGL